MIYNIIFIYYCFHAYPMPASILFVHFILCILLHFIILGETPHTMCIILHVRTNIIRVFHFVYFIIVYSIFIFGETPPIMCIIIIIYVHSIIVFTREALCLFINYFNLCISFYFVFISCVLFFSCIMCILFAYLLEKPIICLLHYLYLFFSFKKSKIKKKL